MYIIIIRALHPSAAKYLCISAEVKGRVASPPPEIHALSGPAHVIEAAALRCEIVLL